MLYLIFNILHPIFSVFFSLISNWLFLGGESFGKGDIWFLWRSESNTRSTEEVFSEKDPAPVLNKSTNCGSSESGDNERNKFFDSASSLSLASLQAIRSSFLDNKLKFGYPLPWHKGILWQV